MSKYFPNTSCLFLIYGWTNNEAAAEEIKDSELHPRVKVLMTVNVAHVDVFDAFLPGGGPLMLVIA